MFIPISHEETRVRRLPWVTFGIMALVTGLLVATDLRGDADTFVRFGLVPADPTLLGMATHMFLHVGWGHLLGNLLLLYLAGPPLEDRWGRPLFAGFTLSAGLFAGGFYALLSSGSEIPMVGASGAIAGLMGASVIRFWSTEIRFFYFYWALRFHSGTFSAPVWAMLPIWFVAQLFLAGLSDRIGVAGGVAYWCHVGGFLFGAGVAFAMKHWQVEERFLDGALEAKVTLSSNPEIDEAMELRIQGETEAAYELLRGAAEKRGDDPDIVGAYWELACELRRVDDAVPRLVAVMKRGFNRGDLDLAVRCWRDLADQARASQVDRQLLVRLVPLLREREDDERAVATLREIVKPERGPMSTGMAFRVLDMARDLDPPTALVAARCALEAKDLPDEKRERIQSLADDFAERCAGLETIADVAPAPASGVPAGETGTQPVDGGEELGIPLEYDAVYDFTPPSQTETPTESSVCELDASGSLVASDSLAELSDDSLPDALLTPAPALTAPTPEPAAEVADAASSHVDFPVPKVFAPMEPASPDPGFDSMATSGASGVLGEEPLPDSPLSLPAAPTSDRVSEVALDASAAIGRFFGVKMIEAVPLELRDDGLLVRRSNQKRGRIDYEAISALSVAAIGELGSKPVLIIDLILNWNDSAAEQIQLIRMRSDAFNVRALISEEMRSIDAFRALQEQLLARTNAQPLPDRDAVRGRPFRSFGDLDSYEREVLQIEG